MNTVTTSPSVYSHDAIEAAPRAAWNRATWGPILMGAIAAIGLQFVFTLLGLAIGLSSVSVGEADSSTAPAMGFAASAWWLVTGTLALLGGGMVYGRTVGLMRHMQLYLGAFAVWAAVALFGFMVIWSGAGIASEATSPLAAMSMNRDEDRTRSFDRRDLDGTANSNADATTNMDRRDAEMTLAQAEEARRAVRTAAWWALIGMLAGIAATMAGAAGGVPRRLVERDALNRNVREANVVHT
jgi:hypothetical protein